MTTRQRKLNSNLEPRRADEQSRNENQLERQRELSRLAQERLYRERLNAEEEQRSKLDPLSPYGEPQTPRLFTPNGYYGETTEQQRLERIIQILWMRVCELERDVEFLRER